MRSTITSSIRQSIRNSIQSVLDSLQPLFDLPAMKTLVPTVGTTPTFTRATTKTGTNYDGQVFTGLSNEPVFEGARRVENLITASEDMTNGAFTVAAGAAAVSATQATFDGTTDGRIYQQVSIAGDGSGAGGRSCVGSAEIRLVSGTVSSDSSIRIALGGNFITPGGSVVLQNIGASLSGGDSARFAVAGDSDAAGALVNLLVYCDDAITLEITNWQLEKTTANSDTSIPSEYVSTGADHGANIDGVQYFLQTNPNTVNGGVVTSDEAHWLELDGTAGNYASTPDSAAASVTGNITLIAGAAPADHTPPSNDENLIAKYNATSGQRSYRLYIDTTGALGFTVSSDGTFAAGNNKLSTATTGFADGTYHWYRASWAASTGTVTFYTSDDPIGTALGSISWVQLGDAVTTTATSIYDSAEPLEIGSTASGTSELFEGKISRAVVIASTDPTATPAVDFNAETAIADGWTIHSTGDTQLKTNKAMTFTEERTGPIALSTALAVDDGFNASSFLHGAVEAFPNLLPPAARVDFEDEWTQTGTGSITPVGDGVELNNLNDASTGNNSGISTSWTETGGGTTLTVEAGDVPTGSSYALSARFDSPGGRTYMPLSTLGLVENEWYAVKLTAKYDPTTGTGNVACSIAATNNSNLGNIAVLSAAETTYVEYTHLFQYNDSNGFFVIKESNVPSTGGATFNVSFQKLSHTTLSDEDATASEALWSLDVTIPTDDETYQVPITLSEGTAAATDLEIRFSGTSTDINRVTHTWATGISTVDANQSGNTTINTAANSDGTVTLTMGMTDIAANTTISIRLFPATNDTSLQGTVNVHGDVVLNRVSVAAEPTWNTLRPGDSVEQLILQQESLDTSPWVDGNTPTLTQDLTDMFGVSGKGWRIEDDNASGYDSIQQTITVGTNTDEFVWCAPLEKVSSVDGYPAIRCDNSGTLYDVVCDPINGKAIARTGRVPDDYGCIDGSVIQALMPHITEASRFWFFWMRTTNDNVGSSIVGKIYPAYALTFSDSESTSATGTCGVDKPFMHEGKYPFFFDSITTTAKVTEVIQDWSKIFSYSSEASHNVANIVFDHNYLEGAGVNIEGARTNVCTDSQDLSSNWTNSNSVDAQNVGVAPDGTTTANRITDNSAGGSGEVYMNHYFTATSGNNVASAFFKADQLSWCRLQVFDFDVQTQANFNLSNGEVGGTLNTVDEGVEYYGNGWYRCWIVFNTTTDLAGRVIIYVADSSSTVSVDKDGTSSILVWGAQVEAGSFPSSYIKTEASSATRNTDLLTYSAVGVADTFPMTLSTDVIPSQLVRTSEIFLGIDNGGVTPRTQLRAASGVPRLRVSPDGGGTTVVIDATSPMVTGTTTAIAGAVSTTSSRLYVDGLPDGPEDTSSTLPTTLSTIRIGTRWDNGSAPYANIRNVKIFDKRLTDAEVSKL